MTDIALPRRRPHYLARLFEDYGQEIVVLAAIVVLFIVVGLYNPRFLSDTNTADFLNAIPGEYWGVYSGEGSVYNNGTIVRATIGQLVDETANHQGQVSFSVNNPAIWRSTVDIVQEW